MCGTLARLCPCTLWLIGRCAYALLLRRMCTGLGARLLACDLHAVASRSSFGMVCACRVRGVIVISGGVSCAICFGMVAGLTRGCFILRPVCVADWIRCPVCIVPWSVGW